MFLMLAVWAGFAAAQTPQKATPKPHLKVKAAAAGTHPKAAKAAKAAAAPNSTTNGEPATAALVKTQPTAGHRDPFTALITEKKPETGKENLPPGKGGLVISTVRVDGTVRSGAAMIAVLSNPDERVYFVREGDHLYDGDVEKIGLDGVTFRENSKDAFGKPVERTVTKRIYASAGDQQ
jgi:hypothetical protein